MHILEPASITRLLHISSATLQSCPHRRRRRSSFNQVPHALANQDHDSNTQLQNLQNLPPHKRTPLVDAVVHRGQQTHEAPFHVPGHKRGSTVPPSLRNVLGSTMQYDLTELDGLDYLSSPEGPILQAQQLAAEAWGAERTWFLVNGTTVGIHAAILSTCSTPNSTLILARNAHQSAFNAAALAGCQVEYALPSTAWGLAHQITPKALEDAFQRAKMRGLHPKAAFIVSPTYFGIVSDINALVKVCHKHEAVLIVDEAHGAHLHFLPFPTDQESNTAAAGMSTSKSALDLGADVVIQSTHKLLGALTQGAMLHLNKTHNSLVESPVKKDLIPKITRALSILQTSSPSYLLMVSLDAARAQVQDPEAVKGPHAAATALHAWFETYYKKKSTPSSAAAGGGITLRLLTSDVLPDKEASMDPWRFTVLLENGNNNEKNFNFSADDSSKYFFNSGWEAAAALERECGVVAELATKNSIVFAVGMGTTMQHAEALIRGLEWLSTCCFSSAAGGGNESLAEERNEKDIPLDNSTSTSINTGNFTTNRAHLLPEIVLTPRDALYAITKEVPWIVAANRISAELLCPYPPGVPAVYPGERIHQEVLDMLVEVVKNGGKVVGAADATLKTVTVIVD